MDRTYNFQVDNGLFVAEYYLNKQYEDITINDLKENVNKFASLLHDFNKIKVKNKQNKYSNLSYQTHLNSKLTQSSSSEKDKLNSISKQLEMLINNVSQDKVCMLCGKKQVNTKKIKRIDNKQEELDYIPSTSFLAGLPSTGSFFNYSNNLQTIDVCPVCLFLAYISFLNTQKISYPFLYLSDSDEFMRDITNEIQNNVQANKILDITQVDLDKHFVDTMSKLMQYKLIYDDMNYISLIFFQNGKQNYYNEYSISKNKILFLLRLKHKGLINEFYQLRLFKPLLNDKFLIPYLIDYKKLQLKCSDNMLIEIKEEIMSEQELQMIEYATAKLLKHNDVNDLLKDLKLCNDKYDFQKFIIDYSSNEAIYKDLNDFTQLVNKHYKYKNLLVANLLLNKNKEEE